MHRAPKNPGDDAVHAQPPEVRDGGQTPKHGELPVVPISNRPRAAAFNAGTDDPREIAAMLFRDRGQGGKRSRRPCHVGNVANGEDALMVGN